MQLQKLKSTNVKRQRITKHYNDALKPLDWIKTPSVSSWARSSHHNYTILVPASFRNRLIDYLSQKGIATSVHYYPNHLYPIFKKYRTKLPVTERVWKKILLLPIFPDLTYSQQYKVIRALKRFKK